MTIDVTTDVTIRARPFMPVVIKPKTAKRGPRRLALRLNRERDYNGKTYHLVLVPYSPQELAARRRRKTRLLKPLMPDVVPKPKAEEDWVFNGRPVQIELDAKGHLQWIREDRLERAQENSPWAA